MIYPSDLSNLVSSWNIRANRGMPKDYEIAVRECMYDLNRLIKKSFNEEIEAKEAFEQQIADDYLSTIEAHELTS